MPTGDASMEGHVHDLYAQARAARQQAELLAGQLAESRRKTREILRLIQDSRGETVRLRARRQAHCTDQDWLRYSAYARLQARLATMPVIEQAKGILMARYGWSADRAFEVLRRVSQRENVKVRDLAARIVARADSGGAKNRYRASA
jgi:ANTAR domain